MGDSLLCTLVNKSGNFQTKSMPDGNTVFWGVLFSAYALYHQEGKVQHWMKHGEKMPSEPVVLFFFLKQKHFPLN